LDFKNCAKLVKMVLKVEADTLSGRIPIGPWIGQG